MATQKEIAEWLGVTDRTVRTYLDQGILPQAEGKGEYNLKECRHAYYRHLISLAGAGDCELNLTDERAKLYAARTETIEHDLSDKHDDYLPLANIKEVLTFMATESIKVFDESARAIKKECPSMKADHLEGVQDVFEQAKNRAQKMRLSESELKHLAR